MASRSNPRPRAVDVFEIGGVTFGVPALPYCDCDKPEWKGMTKRMDGVWVRACCMRRSKQMYDKYGDKPVPY